jgi:hypothetical protein
MGNRHRGSLCSSPGCLCLLSRYVPDSGQCKYRQTRRSFHLFPPPSFSRVSGSALELRVSGIFMTISLCLHETAIQPGEFPGQFPVFHQADTLSVVPEKPALIQTNVSDHPACHMVDRTGILHSQMSWHNPCQLTTSHPCKLLLRGLTRIPPQSPEMPSGFLLHRFMIPTKLIRNRFLAVHAQASASERKGALSYGNYVGKMLRGQERG